MIHFVFEAHAQTLTNKTIAGTSNTLTDTSNNIFTKGTTPNRLYPAGMQRGSPTAMITSTTGPTVNTLYAMPFEVPTATTFDQISAEVTTLGSGSNIRLGVYDDSNGYPGALRFDSANISSATTGHKTATITAGVQAFKPGLYWLAYENSATVPQIRCLPGTDGLAIIGYPAPPSTTIPGLCYTVAHTVGALPNPYTAAATIRNTVSAVGSPIPAVMLRAI